MSDPKHSKPGLRPGPAADPAAPAARPGAPATTHGQSGNGKPRLRTGAGVTGKVVHDERGNAVWDWVAQTSRVALNATSRLLRKLEATDLKMEDTKDQELRIAPEPSKDGGYDPYNQVTKPPKPGCK